MDDGLAERMFEAFWKPIVDAGYPPPAKWNELGEAQHLGWQAAATAARREMNATIAMRTEMLEDWCIVHGKRLREMPAQEAADAWLAQWLADDARAQDQATIAALKAALREACDCAAAGWLTAYTGAWPNDRVRDDVERWRKLAEDA